VQALRRFESFLLRQSEKQSSKVSGKVAERPKALVC
jgi:hypothetical protein